MFSLLVQSDPAIKLNQKEGLRKIKNESVLDTGQGFCVKLGRKKRCYLSAFDCYLGDDLAVLSVDLSDAAPLCQEGEDLVELQEEDSKTVKTTLVPISCTSHEAERPL